MASLIITSIPLPFQWILLLPDWLIWHTVNVKLKLKCDGTVYTYNYAMSHPECWVVLPTYYIQTTFAINFVQIQYEFPASQCWG